MAIALDVTGSGTGINNTGFSFSLNHAANVMVVLVITQMYNTTTLTVTCGGVNMNLLQSVSQSTNMKTLVYYLYVTGAANDTISASGFGTGIRSAGVCASYTGVANAGAGSFEGTNTNNGSGTSVQTETCNVAAGTAGRLVIGGVGYVESAGTAGSITIAPNNSENERIEVNLAGAGAPTNVKAVSAQLQDFSGSGAHSSDTQGTKSGRTLWWGVVAFALLPPTSTPSSLFPMF